MSNSYPPIDSTTSSGLSEDLQNDEHHRLSSDGKNLNTLYADLKRNQETQRRKTLRNARIAAKRRQARLKRKKRKSKGK